MKADENILRDILRLLVWFPFRWFTRIIPVSWSFYLFKITGDIHFHAGSKKKNIAKNLKRLLKVNNDTALHIVRKNLENHYIDRLHIFLYLRLTTRGKIE